MKFERLGREGDIAHVTSDEVLIRDVQSALDVLMSARYETGCDKLILDKACVVEDFFILSTGLAGEILQKFVNYQMRLAIVGEFSGYTSKPLRAFIKESNKGRDVWFLSSVEDAVEKFQHS